MGDMSLVESIGALWRSDGWENAILGIGGVKDPSAYTSHAARARLPDDLLESLYVEDHFAARVVEAIVKEAMRPGWDLVVPGDPAKSASISSSYRAREDELGVAEEHSQGGCWGRLFGGALTWIGADDGNPSAVELDETKIATVRFLHTFDKRDVDVHRYYQDPLHPKFRRPEQYRVRPRLLSAVSNLGAIGRSTLPFGDAGGTVIHETRCIVWRGQPTTDTRRVELQGWDDSILERCWDALRQVAEDYGAKSLILNRVSQAIYKIKDLYAMIAGKKEAILRSRIGMLDASRSRSRAIVLDTEESFENTAQPLGGVDTLLDKSILRLASSAGMPVAVLMGAGIAVGGALADGDLEQWAAQCDTWRAQELRPRHERLARILMLAKDGPTGGVEPEKWEIRYRPLRVPRPAEVAALRKLEADTYAVYIDKALASPEALAVHLFSPSNGLTNFTLDEAELRAALERRKLLASQPPKDNAELGTVAPRDSALEKLQIAYYGGTIPREAALARLELVFRFTREDAEKLLATPPGWEPPDPEDDDEPEEPDPGAPPAPGGDEKGDEGKPGPAPNAPNGTGAGAPQGLPGFNAGGDPKESTP